MRRLLITTVTTIALFTVTSPTGASQFVHYSFDPPDSAADGQATDNSGNGRTGVLETTGNGSYAFSDDTPLFGAGRSLELTENGPENAARLVNYINPGELDFSTGDWTVALWANRRDLDSTDFLFHIGGANGYGGANEIHLHGEVNGDLQLWHNDIAITVGGAAMPGTWFHAAVVHDATLGEVTLYVNGQAAGMDNSFSFGMGQGPIYPFVFGGHGDLAWLTPRYIDGWLDEAYIFDEALGSSAIQQLASIPEPSTALLLLSGLVLIRRRRRTR